jgi:hypothetical protein
VARSGTWVYDGTVRLPVDLVALAYDYWFEFAKADGTLDPGEAPQPLGPDGCLYYLRFRKAGDLATPTWVDSQGCRTIEEATTIAEARAPSPIAWA